MQRATLADLLWARASRTRPAELVGLFVLGWLIAFFRAGKTNARGVLWAEDGRIFLQDAHTLGRWASVPEQQAGYLNLVPRLIASAASFLPLSWQAVAISAGAVAVQAGVGVLLYAAATAWAPGRIVRLVLFAYVVAIPVAPELIGSIANSQWLLLFGGLIALLWTPPTRLGEAALLLTVLAATTSSPFAGFLLILALLRLAIVRNRLALVAAITTTIGFTLQTTRMLTAPERETHHDVRPFVQGYLRRVLGDGLFGTNRLRADVPAPSIWAGLLVLAVIVTLATILVRQHSHRALALAALLGVLSYASYVVPMILTANGTEWPYIGTRYSVTPILLAMTALLVMASAVFTNAFAPERGPNPRLAMLGAAVVGAALVGLSTNLSPDVDYGRSQAPSWATVVATARSNCATLPADTVVLLPIAPAEWFVYLPCSVVR